MLSYFNLLRTRSQAKLCKAAVFNWNRRLRCQITLRSLTSACAYHAEYQADDHYTLCRSSVLFYNYRLAIITAFSISSHFNLFTVLIISTVLCVKASTRRLSRAMSHLALKTGSYFWLRKNVMDYVRCFSCIMSWVEAAKWLSHGAV